MNLEPLFNELNSFLIIVLEHATSNTELNLIPKSTIDLINRLNLYSTNAFCSSNNLLLRCIYFPIFFFFL